MEAFLILVVGPIFDTVLHPATTTNAIELFHIPGTPRFVYLQQFVPSHFHNVLSVVAVALLGASFIKVVCDYLGTYLVNYAGFGLITDLRNRLYQSILHRSVGFFSRHSTGTLVSTVINDVEKVQTALSAVMAEFLQQFFTLIFTAMAVVVLGGRLAWILVLFVPFVIFSAGRIGRNVRSTTLKGQDKLADIQNILHESMAV